MSSIPLILGSASPRRLQLLRQIGLNPSVKTADIDETPLQGERPIEYASRLAMVKGRSIVERFGDHNLVVAADTIVIVDQLILGKPVNPLEARAFMTLLSGRSHDVVTAVSLFWKKQELVEFEKTHVVFEPLSDDMIDAYIATGDYKDKAGGYGIQSFAALFIPRIEGCFFNVMGFPINLFYRMTCKMGLNIFANDGNDVPQTKSVSHSALSPA